MAFWQRKYSDEKIISGIRSREMLWEELFYKQFKSPLKGFYKKKYKIYQSDNALFTTAYHETVSAVFKNIRSENYQQTSTLSTYVHDIFQKKCIDEIRKLNKKSHETGDDISELYDISDKNILIDTYLLQREALEAAEQTLKKIGENCYDVVMKHFEGYKDKEIAIQLNMVNAKTVKSRRYTCMKKFKMAIEAQKLYYAFQ